jgi:Secretion system C-terminal sorting domain
MKKILLLLVFITNSFAQNNATSFDWSFNGGGGFNTTKRLQYNSQGDLIFLLDVGHQTIFGGTTISYPGFGQYPGTASFIGKRTQSGTSTVLIQKSTTNPTSTTFQDFVIDNDDNIIVTGATFGYNSTVFYDFGNGITLYGKGNFIAKYNPQGICQWVKLVDYGITGAMPYSENKNIGLGILPNNDIYYANRSTNGNTPFWLLKLNPAGTEIWHKEWILPNTNSVAILTSKNNFFFDNTGKAYFYIYCIQGDVVTLEGTVLTPPAGAHPTTSSLVTINNDGTNGVFTTYRGAIADMAVEKSTGNVLLDWRQYVVNPAPFNTIPLAVNNTYQYAGIIAIDSNRNFINRTAVSFTISVGSLFPLGNLNFVTNTRMVPSETITIPNQTFTATKYTPTWKFFENFEFTKFVAHPEINDNVKNYDLMALYNNKLAVSGGYNLANNPTIAVNGTTLTSCANDPNFATLFPVFATSQSDVFISQLTIDNSLTVSDNKLSNFKIYPNPATNYINLSFEKNLEKASLKIISILGQIILEKQNLSGNDFNFDVSNLSKGIYIMEVNDGVSVTNSKFIKE